MTRTLLSWSGGKDATWALQALRTSPDVDVAGLLCTVDAATDLVAMHGVPAACVQAQADALDLPLVRMRVAWPCTDRAYLEALAGTLRAEAPDARAIAFGDLFLEDLRAWRENALASLGLGARFPLWQRPTRALAEEMLAAGLRARVVAVDTTRLPGSLAGSWWSRGLLDALPPGVDPCGENGEFHTFVTDGPGFAHPVEVTCERGPSDPRFQRARVRLVGAISGTGELEPGDA